MGVQKTRNTNIKNKTKKKTLKVILHVMYLKE